MSYSMGQGEIERPESPIMRFLIPLFRVSICRKLYRKHLHSAVTCSTFSFHKKNCMKGAEWNPTISNASSHWLKWELDLLLSKLTFQEVFPKSHVTGFLILSSLWGLRWFLNCLMTYMLLNATYRTN